VPQNRSVRALNMKRSGSPSRPNLTSDLCSRNERRLRSRLIEFGSLETPINCEQAAAPCCYSGVLTPQARIAHQPIHASKAQNNPIRIKIVARKAVSGMRQPPAKRKMTAMPPRAARPLLSIFCFIMGATRVSIPTQTRLVARLLPVHASSPEILNDKRNWPV